MGGGGSLHPHGGSQPFPNLSLLNFIGTRHTQGAHMAHKRHTWHMRDTHMAHAVHICTGSQNMNALIHKPDISKNGKKLGMGEGMSLLFWGCDKAPRPEAV